MEEDSIDRAYIMHREVCIYNILGGKSEEVTWD
jgi:hypothetical protein